ncbi:MAG: PSD1 domain-containing protein [Planctomycetes bacterium]|nr:PSD1 domain-containing protein [Planctomycetota bacterium]
MELSALLLCGFAGVAPVAPGGDDGGPIRFARDVRPLLSEYCFACHGPDAAKREAELRLDTRAGLYGDAARRGVVVPGALEQSELWRRIGDADEMERMPPAAAQKELPPAARATLRRWIEQGAPFEGHWAYQPLSRPQLPPPPQGSASWPPARNEIDAFLRAPLTAQRLAPAPAADRATLLRRLSLDLLGLPPTALELAAFLADRADDAWERQVDRLLASPHYGERMAMQWLDLVRYADSVGYHGDQEVSVSPFRDWVIAAFNANLPFDTFTIEQLAGDLLPEPTLRQQVASGYNRLGMMSAEGGVQPKEYLAKYVAERVRNLGGTWLGSTLGCCECHDHKFDPFLARDFYSFAAFFADLEERGLYSGAEGSGDWGPRIAVPSDEQAAQLARLDAELAAARAERDASEALWQTLRPSAARSVGGATLTLQDDGSLLASGAAPDTDRYELTFAALPPGATALRLEVLPDESLPNRGPGRAGNGNFVLSEIVARVGEQPLAIAGAVASFEQHGAAGGNPYGRWAVAAAIDRDAQGARWGWAVMEQAGRANVAWFTLAPLAREAERVAAVGAAAVVEPAPLTIELDQQHGAGSHTLGRFRLSVTTASPPIAPALARIAELEAQRAALDAEVTRTLVARSVAPRAIRVLPRGRWMDESGALCDPDFPAFLPRLGAPTDRRLTRLDLARWLVHPDHPLTARVFVNRLWKRFFGEGLSRRLDDFGAQGEWPSHPDLLDWLARRFIDSGFDVKALVRLLVTSAAYRQRSDLPDGSAVNAGGALDPDNRWFARQARFRLEAELVRDVALRASGLLVETIGGRSVRPYQPAGYWAYLNFPTREWQADADERLWRRGLYVHWQRQYLHPSLLAFDAPSREECTADRARSNTPLQALVLLNDPIYVEAARALAQRMIEEGGATVAERLAYAYWRVVARAPRQEEAARLAALLEQQRAEYAAAPAAAHELLAIGVAPLARAIDPVELAAWTAVARVLLNLHEGITRD